MRPPCLHKRVEHQCGTNARYVLDRCRCEPCADARRAADRRRAKYNAGVTEHPLVDAQPVREHCESLAAQGMGPKRIAEVSGIPHGAVSKLLYGDYTRGMAPSRRVHRKTAEALLSTVLDVADGAKVDATEAKEIIAELLARGWWKAEIGRRIHGPQARSLQVALTDLVFAGTLRTLRRLQVEPVPKRFHSPTGKWITPTRDHIPQMVDASTPGVPITADLARAYHELWLREMRRGLAEALELARNQHRDRWAA